MGAGAGAQKITTDVTGNVAEDVGKVVETRVVEQLLYMGQMI